MAPRGIFTASLRAIALAGLLVSACDGTSPAPDFMVGRTGVVVRSSAPFATQPDLRPRLESTLAAALAYWGGTWDDLAAVDITLDGRASFACGGIEGASGCWDGDIRVSTSDQGREIPCVEATTLVHEVGHAVLGDPRHDDPRWMDFAPVARALEGRPGYDASGEAACRIAVSVWRHPLHCR